MLKPNSAIDTQVEKLAKAVGKRTSRRGFLDRLAKVLFAAGAGTAALLIPGSSRAAVSQDCYSVCYDMGVACASSCIPECINQYCATCCNVSLADCYDSCDASGFPAGFPNCCTG